MKTIRFKRVAGIFLALTLSIGTAFSTQNTGHKNRQSPETQKSCIHSISGLSELQKDKITAMETRHFIVMNELREKIQSSSEKKQKAEIRKEMDQQIEIHGNAVKSVLSADQQTQFILHQTQGGPPDQKSQMQGKGKGSGSGHGNGSGQGKGRGMGMRNKGF